MIDTSFSQLDLERALNGDLNELYSRRKSEKLLVRHFNVENYFLFNGKNVWRTFRSENFSDILTS